jgi:hypothetical protein
MSMNPCMSCGGDRNELAPEGCKDKRAHVQPCRIHPERKAVAYGSMCEQCYDHYLDD